MKSIEESVVEAMDGLDKKLYPFLPFIMQDLWEFGTSAEVIKKLIQKHSQNFSDLNILDLGCGKGCVCIKLAKEFGCSCLGIDAVKEFIGEARIKSKEWQVDERCKFVVGDLRTKISELDKFDVIILGAIGPVLGNYKKTLSLLNEHLNKNGIIIIDDSYIDSENNFTHPQILKKNIIIEQINKAGMQLLDENIIAKDELKSSDDFIFEKIIKRCNQLIEMYPDNSQIFLDYIITQQQENEILERKVTCSTMVIKRKVN
jgi:ubiquinone/menaquinone biosynthesis C-methylase UbiE